MSGYGHFGGRHILPFRDFSPTLGILVGFFFDDWPLLPLKNNSFF